MGIKKERWNYVGYFLKNAPLSIKIRLFHKGRQLKRFLGAKGISIDQSKNVLQKKIKSGKPFCAIRFGAVELSCWNNFVKKELGFKKEYKKPVLYSIKNNAGVFPIEENILDRYSSESLALLQSVDVLAISGINMEDYFAKKYCKTNVFIQNWAMEPLIGEYTNLFKDKKILVVSPFAEDIKNQYKKRELLFKNADDILPNFQLHVIEAPLTLADGSIKNSDWFKELNKMKEQMRNIDFDILLVGAGAYGMHLAIFAKQLGKQGIQSGGATQTLFGIIGRRWENRDHVKKHVNEHWIRPSRRDISTKTVENGAYW